MTERHSTIQLSLSRVAAAVIALALFSSGCSGSEPEPIQEDATIGSSDQAAPVVSSARQAHELQEDEISRCMRSLGFEYIRRPFVEYWDDGVSIADAGVFLSAASERGYSGVFTALVVRLTSAGTLPQDLAPQERAAYETALSGSGATHPHADSGGSHSHGDGENHSHLSAVDVGGCFAEGESIRRQLEIEPNADEDPLGAPSLAEDFFQRVFAAPEFGAFESEWRQCLQDAGLATDGSASLQQYSIGRQFEYAGEAARRLQSIEPAKREQMSASLRFGTQWLESAAAVDPELQAILDRERSHARIDAGCRAESRPLLEPAFENAAAVLGFEL